MNEPTEPTEPTDPDAPTEDTLRGLALEADAERAPALAPAAAPDGESEAAGPPADDAAPSPAAPPAADAPPDPEPSNPAAELTRLREDLARQKAEIARLIRLTSLQGGSGPGAVPAAPKRFAELSDREMETELTRMAADLDGF